MNSASGPRFGRRYSASYCSADSTGTPAYEVTASYSYVGGYEVFVMGQLIGSGTFDSIDMTSVTSVAVNEAQAINTGAGG